MIEKSQAQADEGKTNQRMHGKVLYNEGGAPLRVVEIDLACPTFDRLMATSDSKGRFSFSFDSKRQSDAEVLSAGCYLYASLDGYSSERIDLARNDGNEHLDLGAIVLTPLSKKQNGLESSTEDGVKADARRRYQSAIDKGAHNNLPAAIGMLREVVSANAN